MHGHLNVKHISNLGFSAVQTALFLIFFIKCTRSNDGLFFTRPLKFAKDKIKIQAVADKLQHGTVLSSYSAPPPKKNLNVHIIVKATHSYCHVTVTDILTLSPNSSRINTYYMCAHCRQN